MNSIEAYIAQQFGQVNYSQVYAAASAGALPAINVNRNRENVDGFIIISLNIFAPAAGLPDNVSITLNGGQAIFSTPSTGAVYPLFAIGDFCYVVKGSAMNLVGAANLNYSIQYQYFRQA